ncbi:MAG: efflux RND transporter periplasmic adaptor subunit [Woeseiaceae bacterium]
MAPITRATNLLARLIDYKFLCVFVSILLSGCAEKQQSTEPRLRPVKYMTVSDGGATRDRSFSGVSKSSLESRLSFKVPGTITNVPVQIGQRLAAGDLIAEIDPEGYLLQVQQAQASLVEAQANERQAASNYDRTKGLYANDNASLNDLDVARARAESAQAVVGAANKALEIARLNSSYTQLKAETQCSIASIDVEVNENVSAGQQVAAVSCGDDFEVTLDIPESLIGGIDEYTPVSMRFGSIPGEIFSGQISEVAVSSLGGSATFPIVIKVNERHPSLRSGLAADVTFQFDSASASGTTIVLPVAAVVNDPSGTYVFVAEPTDNADESVVRRRSVELGELTQSGIEIANGLQVGDRIITAGITVIREDQRVLTP